MSKIAVHFGGGALGRGLVVPFLEEAGFEVIVVDIDKNLLKALNDNDGYILNVTDVPEKTRKIHVKAAVDFDASNTILKEYLKKAQVITTSVRKENLGYVADILVKILDENDEKIILCAENIERSGKYFKQILEKKTEKHYDNFYIPDTVVDRICASKWPESLELLTEDFGEFGFEKNDKTNTMGPIKAFDDLERAFVRKRLLVNTYCDACCFLGKSKGDQYLSEAVVNEDVQSELKEYFDTFEKVLEEKYLYTANEIRQWKQLYQKRLSNPKIRRDLDTVARGLWNKLGYSERFLLPIIQLIELGDSIEEPMKALCHMIIECGGKENTKEKLQQLWSINEIGQQIYQYAEKYI